MPNSTRIDVVRAVVDAGEARAALARTGGAGFELDRTVYYPYHWYRASGSAPRLLGRCALSVHCLVDACTGIASTADRFRCEPATVPAGAVIGAKQSRQRVVAAARRYVTHALGRGTRTLADFGVRLEHAGTVYKAFWIFGSGGLRVLVDSTTGGIHPLGEHTVDREVDGIEEIGEGNDERLLA